MTVVARHIGRLGNNLFQISASIGYARKYGYKWAADPKAGMGEPYSSIHKVFPNLPKQTPSGYRHHEHPHGICNQHTTPYDYCHFDYHNIPDLGANVTLTGFFQSWKYFEHCKEEVKEVFKLNHIDGFQDYTSLHVRLGDYLQHSGSFPPLTPDYIRLSLRAVKKHTNIKHCLVFSDDIPLVKTMVSEGLEGFLFEYSEGRNEIEDLSLMASCGHHIIANSTFSWWAAYLGHNPQKIVITPSAETWFGVSAGVKKPVHDLLLPEWHQIPTR